MIEHIAHHSPLPEAVLWKYKIQEVSIAMEHNFAKDLAYLLNSLLLHVRLTVTEKSGGRRVDTVLIFISNSYFSNERTQNLKENT